MQDIIMLDMSGSSLGKYKLSVLQYPDLNYDSTTRISQGSSSTFGLLVGAQYHYFRVESL